MKKLLLILLCLPMIGFGQGWERTYREVGVNVISVGYSVQQTTDGGYIICGRTTKEGANGMSDAYLIKTNGNGDSLWSKTFGHILEPEIAYSVQQTTDGGYVMTGHLPGYLSGGGDGDVYLIKTNSIGDSLWTKTFGGPDWDYGNSIQQTVDGGYIITGQVNDLDVYLIKTDVNGDSLWTRSFSGNAGDRGAYVQQTTDGGYIITGTKGWTQLDPGVYLIKTDENGLKQWDNVFYGNSIGACVQQTNDGGYIIVGTVGLNLASEEQSAYLIKTNSIGDSLWTKTFGGLNADGGSSVQQTTDGGYIIAGFTKSFGDTLGDVYVVKTDANGEEQWSQTYGGAGYDAGSSVQQTTDGGYVIAGFTKSFGAVLGDVYLIKTDANGNATSTFNIPIDPNRKLQKTVDILGRETKPQTNIPFIEIYDDGTVEKRIVIE